MAIILEGSTTHQGYLAAQVYAEKFGLPAATLLSCLYHQTHIISMDGGYEHTEQENMYWQGWGLYLDEAGEN